MLRNVQEVLAEKEFLAGTFYWSRQAFPAASARLSYVADQYPLFSQADEALWELADSYNRLGDRWEDKAAQAYSKIVKEYPLSAHADDAKEKLQAMKRPVPAADPEAMARMKYNEEHYVKASKLNLLTSPAKSLIVHNPDVRAAAKIGDPSMETKRPPTPISVPTPAGGVPGTSGGDVTASATTASDIDSKPDARTGGAPVTGSTPGGTPTTGTPAAGTPGSSDVVGGKAPTSSTPTEAAKTGALPTNYQTLNLNKKQKKPKKVKQAKNAVNSPPSVPGVPAAPAGTTPAPATAPAAGTPPATDAAAPPK